MISKIVLNPNENLKPATVTWDSEKEDYVIDTPDGLTRCELIDFVEELKRITEWGD